MSFRETDQQAGGDCRIVATAAVKTMLANLQEAVVTVDPDVRRALLKDVIGDLQDVLSSDARR